MFFIYFFVFYLIVQDEDDFSCSGNRIISLRKMSRKYLSLANVLLFLCKLSALTWRNNLPPSVPLSPYTPNHPHQGCARVLVVLGSYALKYLSNFNELLISMWYIVMLNSWIQMYVWFLLNIRHSWGWLSFNTCLIWNT